VIWFTHTVQIIAAFGRSFCALSGRFSGSARHNFLGSIGSVVPGHTIMSLVGGSHADDHS
jgi:hypothetical protein